jgi:diguanylate cyclase (GGDEF)-like protein/PAS domain S-box-containing protein
MLMQVTSNRPTILVVDDQPSNIQLLREAVLDMGEVYFATNGVDALAICRERNPDILLLDIEMPGMNGYEVCKAIKDDPQLCDIAIIFVTSHERELHELAAINQGGVDFLQKPIHLPLARARIKTHLALQIKTRELAQARRDLSDVMRNTPSLITHWDSELRINFCNDIDSKWFGLAPSEILGKSLAELLGETRAAVIRQRLPSLASGNQSLDMCFSPPSQSVIQAQVTLVYRSAEDGSPSYLLQATDITARHLAEAALADEKERMHITLHSIGDAVISTDTHGLVTLVNPIAEDLTGWSQQRALGRPIEDIMPLREGNIGYVLRNPTRIALEEDRRVGMALNCILQRSDGRDFTVEDSAAPIRNRAGETTGAVIVFHDVSEAQALAIKMTHLAQHDALTNLPNRMLLQDRTEQALRKSKHNQKRIALLLLDLDNFKSINDTQGHHIGDRLLTMLAERLQGYIAPGDTLSRQGGDEFIILLTEVSHIQHINLFANKILQTIATPFFIDETRFDISASLGIGIYPDDSSDMEELFRHADSAMYSAKQYGRNRFKYYSAGTGEKITGKHLLERQLRVALEEQSFELHYQPKIDALSHTIIGVEALVRWRNPEGVLIPPDDFIPLTEETGLIIPLGLWVMRQAMLDTVQWHNAGFELSVAINISSVQLNDDQFIPSVFKLLEETQINPAQVELEITESLLAENIEFTRAQLEQLRRRGLQIAIDDFGTGYSSLTYLKHLPIDVLKIDRCFVRDIFCDPSDAAIVTAIIHMAKGLNLRLVAEGIETGAQAEALLQQGCHILQGYLFSRPLARTQLTQLLHQGLPKTITALATRKDITPTL